MRKRRLLALFALTLGVACAGGHGGPAGQPPPSPAKAAAAPEPIARLLAAPALAEVLRHAAEHRIQIVVGLIEKDAAGKPSFRQVSWRAGAEYFYPASSVKLFAAVAALEKLHQLRAETGIPVGVDTPLAYYPLFDGEKLEDSDPTNRENGRITVRHLLRKIFLVSDNEAFNKLYELVGQDGLAASLQKAGLEDARLVHRLDELRSPEENRKTPRIDFVDAGLLHSIPERTAPEMAAPPAMPGLLVGKGYLTGGGKVEKPMDFSGKNRLSLTSLQRGLCKVLRPELGCGPGGDFEIDEDDRKILGQAMAEYPGQSKNPVYSAADYPDDSGKFLLPGLVKKIPKEQLRISNKFGQAYGFSTENALVENLSNGKAIFVAATIYTNEDGILNDDRYEYEKVARPFFAALGEVLADLLR